jgi:hypothetical protein
MDRSVDVAGLVGKTHTLCGHDVGIWSVSEWVTAVVRRGSNLFISLKHVNILAPELFFLF